jgi:hypothetical protein
VQLQRRRYYLVIEGSLATTLRIATFNLENFDDPGPAGLPTLATRIALMRPQLERLRWCALPAGGQQPDRQWRADICSAVRHAPVVAELVFP